MKTKALVITHKGLEKPCSLEIEELVKSSCKVTDSAVLFDASSKEDICLLAYRLQSAVKVLELFSSFNFKSLSDIKDKIPTIKIPLELTSKSFVVRSSRKGTHDFLAKDVEREIGEIIYKKYSMTVNLNDPDYIFYVYIVDDTCYFGLDYSGFDLSKREYKIFSHPSALKGTTAFCLLKMVDYSEKKLLLDPFCGSGTIIIEAGLYSGKRSPHFYDKDKFAFLKFIDFDFSKIDSKCDTKTKLSAYGFDHNLQAVSASKKNAKVAGIDKILNFSRVDVEWIDTKLDESSVDLVVSNPPVPSKIHAQELVEKVYKELFYQLEFVLNKKGKILLITRKSDLLKKYAAISKFKLISEQEIMVGKEPRTILIFSK